MSGMEGVGQQGANLLLVGVGYVQQAVLDSWCQDVRPEIRAHLNPQAIQREGHKAHGKEHNAIENQNHLQSRLRLFACS